MRKFFSPYFFAVILTLGLVLVVFFWIFILPESMEKSKFFIAKQTVKSCEQALHNYFMDNKIYPTTNQGLQALVIKPEKPPIPENYLPNGYFKKPAMFGDPWGNPYQYTYQLMNGRHKITILSFGADGKLGGKGYNADIIKTIETKIE
jgi:general secretion pathway protein G